MLMLMTSIVVMMMILLDMTMIFCVMTAFIFVSNDIAVKVVFLHSVNMINNILVIVLVKVMMMMSMVHMVMMVV